MRLEAIKQTVAKELVQAVWQFMYYFERVNTLYEEGKLGGEHALFSEASPLRVFRKLVRELERTFLFQRHHMSKKEQTTVEVVLVEALDLIDAHEDKQ